MTGSLRFRRATRRFAFFLCAAGTVSMMSGVNFASEYSDQVIADGALHYWRFEESAAGDAAKDEIAGPNNTPGTYTGAINLGAPSAGLGLGSAVRLDGTDGTHIALGTPQHPGDSISVEAWINLDVDATASFSPIIARWDGSYELDVNATDNSGLGADRVDFVLRNNTNAFGDPASPAAITRGGWHHVVGIFADGDGTVYLDGVAGDSFPLGGTLQDAGGDDGSWYIGTTRGPASGFSWDGMLDEVAIYGRALTQEEIANHIRLAPIPEPSSVFLAMIGGAGIIWLRRRGRT